MADVSTDSNPIWFTTATTYPSYCYQFSATYTLHACHHGHLRMAPTLWLWHHFPSCGITL